MVFLNPALCLLCLKREISAVHRFCCSILLTAFPRKWSVDPKALTADLGMFRAPSKRAVPGLGARLAQGSRAPVTVAGLRAPHIGCIPGSQTV